MSQDENELAILNAQSSYPKGPSNIGWGEVHISINRSNTYGFSLGSVFVLAMPCAFHSCVFNWKILSSCDQMKKSHIG